MRVRSRRYRREMRAKHIRRKKRKCMSIGISWYNCDGKYSKGKIHCGCGLCKWNRRFGVPSLRTQRELNKFANELEVIKTDVKD